MHIDMIPKALMIAFLERKSIELIGTFGIGKTTMARDFVAHLETLDFTINGLVHKAGEPVGMVECLIPTYSVEDIRGFPMPDYDNGLMFYSVPPFFPSMRQFPEGIPKFGIVFLDEARLGPDEVVKATTQFHLERRIGDHSLDQFGHWAVFAASNREDDRVGIGKELPIVTQRKMIINVDPHIGSTVAWIEANEERLGLPPVIKIFAKENPGVVLSNKVPDDGLPFCTPRTLVEAGQLMSRYMQVTHYVKKNKFDMPVNDDFALELMASKIGEGAAAQVQQYGRMVGQVPAYEDIMRHPDTATLPDAERLDAAYVIITQIEHQAGDWSRLPDGKGFDMVKLDQEIESIVTYLMRLPAEFQVVGLRRAIQKRPEIYSSPQVRTIARQNPSLLKAIST